MSMTTSTLSRSLQIGPCRRSQTFIFDPICHLATSKHKDGFCSLGNQSLRYLSTSQRAQRVNKPKMDLVAYCSVQPEGPLPSWLPEHSWQWILGVMTTVILPFMWNKWGPLLKLTKEVETTAESVENVVNVVEKVAEDVEKLAGDIAKDLPAGGQLQTAVAFVENMAQEAAKDAQLADEFLDKVEEVGEEVESFMETASDQSNQSATKKAQ